MRSNRWLATVRSAFLAAALLVSTIGLVWGPGKPAEAANTTYYVDSVNGNDSNSGTSPSAAWKTLGKVNAKTNYGPGDQILFKAGGVWTGSLTIKNSGAPGNPIVVGSYGEGPKPIINANAAYAAINLENVQYITLQDLELTNYNAADPDDYLTGYYRRSGIWIKSFHQGPMKDITIRNMDIHDVTGMSVSGETTVTTTDGKDTNVNKNANAAIQINAWEWDASQPKAYFDNLLIENNYIHDVSTIGINITAHSTDPAYFNKNVIVRGNTVLNNGADGIVVGVTENPLVEYNVSLDAGAYGHGYQWIVGMWAWRTNGAVFQFNEVGRVHTDGIPSEADSSAFDTDIATRGNHIFQYNYSHDNEGGFFMEMGRLQDGINIIRYNISQNDKRNGWSGNTLNISGDTNLIYNNVFYNDLGIGFKIRENPKTTFLNNIFYVTGGSEQYASAPKYYYNAFHGQAAPLHGVNNIVGDPGFVNPGTGVDGIGTVDGYKLKPDSPLIGAGKVIEGNGGRDFWNNPLYTGMADIGAYEDPNSTIADNVAPAAPTAVQVKEFTDSTVTLTWEAKEDGIPLDADIYDAVTDTIVASALIANEATVTGLTPGTEYHFYVVARDRAGNPSAPSGEVQATTLTSVTVDDADAAFVGNWTAATGGASYEGGYHRIPAGTGQNSVTWTPDLPYAGYYGVYYYLPNGSATRAGNAKYTVHGAAAAKTYTVDQRPEGGRWILLGVHRFHAGTSGSVTLTDAGAGEVAADAVKFLYLDGFGPEDIETVKLVAEKIQLRLGETTGYAVYGKDALGRELDLTADGANVQVTSDDPAIAAVTGGVIQGVSAGTADVYATYTVNGVPLTTSPVTIRVGESYTVEEPVFADADGNPLSALAPGVVRTSVTIYNSTETQSRATLVVALYDADGFVSMATQEAVIQRYDNHTLEAPITVPGELDDPYLKVFVWDSTTFMRPLADATVFQ